jgi:hypothetical protein
VAEDSRGVRLEALGARQVHLAGLRVLVPHLTEQNHEAVLEQAAGKSMREIEELAARLAPKPPVPDVIRKLPERAALPLPEASAPATVTRLPLPPSHRPVVAPLSAETFKIQFTGSRQVRDKLRQAQDLLRHRLPDGDLAVVFEKSLDALICNLLKERVAVGRTPRRAQPMAAVFSGSHDIPDPIKRAVWQRDGGQCAFISDDGRRCCETGGLEFDLIDGSPRRTCTTSTAFVCSVARTTSRRPTSSTAACSWSACASHARRRKPLPTRPRQSCGRAYLPRGKLSGIPVLRPRYALTVRIAFARNESSPVPPPIPKFDVEVSEPSSPRRLTWRIRSSEQCGSATVGGAWAVRIHQ